MAKYTPISREELLTYLTPNSLYDYENPFIYKGICSIEEVEHFYYYNPRENIRKSTIASTHGNIYNLLLNNLPSWRAYPLRERSIIGSTSLKTAASFAGKGPFGRTFLIVPKKNAQVMVAPAADIWYSFKYCLAKFNLSDEGNSLKQFNIHVNELMKAAGIKNGYDTSWEGMQNALSELCGKRPNKLRNVTKNAKLIHKVLYLNRGNLTAFLDTAFSPNNNEFILSEYSKFTLSDSLLNNEIWTDSECLFIEIGKYAQYFNDFKGNLRNII